MRKKLIWIAAALVLIAIPAVIGLLALRGDDSSSSRRAGALISPGGGGHDLKMEGLLSGTDTRVIDVESWSWGVANNGTAYSAQTGGAAAGKTTFTEFNFTKHVDTASAKLFLNASKGTVFPKVVLTSRKAGETPQEYLVITLEQVLISSMQLSSGGDEVPTESISLNFAKATISATETGESKAAGAAPGTVTHSWDLRAAKGA